MSDEKIIAAIRNGDETAISWVITKYSRLIWSVASAVLQDAAPVEDIEECVADVFIYLWQNPEKYDAQRGRLKSWLSIVARSRAIDRYRKLSRENNAPLDGLCSAAQPDVLDRVTEEETRQQLLSAVRTLEEPDKEILVRRYCCGQKPKGIALALDMPVKRIENRLYQTKRKLRKMMTDQEVKR